MPSKKSVKISFVTYGTEKIRKKLDYVLFSPIGMKITLLWVWPVSMNLSYDYDTFFFAHFLYFILILTNSYMKRVPKKIDKKLVSEGLCLDCALQD